MHDLMVSVRLYRDSPNRETRQRIAGQIAEWLATEVWKFLIQRCPPDEAEDLLQDTLVAVMRGLDKCKAHTAQQFWAWVYAIARHKLAGRLAQGKRTEAMPLDRLWELVEESGKSEPITGEEREDLEHLRRALAGLKASTRDAILLRYIDDMEFAEIGAHLGKSADAARMEITRGLAELEQALKGILS